MRLEYILINAQQVEREVLESLQAHGALSAARKCDESFRLMDACELFMSGTCGRQVPRLTRGSCASFRHLLVETV